MFRCFAGFILVADFVGGCDKSPPKRVDSKPLPGFEKTVPNKAEPTKGENQATLKTKPLHVQGRWKTVFDGSVDKKGQTGGGQVLVTLVQSGPKVTGSYVSPQHSTRVPPAKMQGTLAGRILKGTWVDESGAKGPFEWVFDASGDRFSGSWRSQDLSGKWAGVRER